MRLSFVIGLCLFTQTQTRFYDNVKDASSTLFKLFDDVLHYNALIENYLNITYNNDVAVTFLNGTELLEEIVQSLDEVLESIIDVLKNTTEYASDLYQSYYNESCCSNMCLSRSNTSQCDLICNVSNFMSTDLSLKYNASLNRIANFDNSMVHIPVNVYSERPDVSCFIEWSYNLTEKFKQNWYKFLEMGNVRIAEQFIGSITSAMRSYPVSSFSIDDTCRCPYESVDTFNVRQRPWYIGTLTDKNVVILIDTSGSMTGLNFKLAKLTAKELISSLTANDFFMVLKVGSTPDGAYKPLGNCFSDLVRASGENKLAMDNIITKASSPSGVADFKDVMKFAYDKLQNSTSCHKIIAIFSDGDATFPVDEFTQMNNQQHVRVFSFKIGQKNYEDDFKHLACRNKGTYTNINNFDKVALSTYAITEELNRHSNRTDVFFHRYIDYTTKELIVTFSMPVKATIDSIPRFVGAIGMDIINTRSKLNILSSKLGSLGYTFAINNNGELIFHPLQSDLTSKDFNTLDVLQLEFEPSKDERNIERIRKEMIDGLSGQTSILSYISMQSQKRYLIKNMTYYYTPVNSTIPLSVCLKLPSDNVGVFTNFSLSRSQLKQLDFYLANISSSLTDTIFVSTKSYCYDQYLYNLLNSSDVISFMRHLVDVALYNTNSHYCSSYLYLPLLNDLYFMYNYRTEITTSDNIINAFVLFSSGLLWCMNSNSCSTLFNANYIGLAENNGMNRLSVYRDDSRVVIVRPLHFNMSSVSIGVAGIILDNLTIADDSIYFIDEGGYIVGGSTINDTEEFIGYVNPVLFQQLLNDKIFVQHVIEGYDKKKCTTNNSYSANYNITECTQFYTEASRQSSSISFESNYSCPSIDLCLYQVTFYLANYSIIHNNTFEFKCHEEDTEMFYYQVAVVPNTSVIAVTTNSSCNRTLFNITIGREEKRLECLCGCLSCQLYRRSSNRCQNNTAVYIDNVEVCSGTLSVQTYQFLILLHFVIITVFYIQ